jgi:hypothetical protein
MNEWLIVSAVVAFLSFLLNLFFTWFSGQAPTE